MDFPTYALYGTQDGYWYGHPPDAVDTILRRYTGKFQILKRPASHLWVIAPDNLDAYLAMVQRGEGIAADRVVEVAAPLKTRNRESR